MDGGLCQEICVTDEFGVPCSTLAVFAYYVLSNQVSAVTHLVAGRDQETDRQYERMQKHANTCGAHGSSIWIRPFPKLGRQNMFKSGLFSGAC